MKRTTPHATRFDSVKGKVVVVSGGATGIGAATVERLAHSQAHVIFGDMDGVAATAVLESLEAEEGRLGQIAFVQGSVRNHIDVYKLFKTAYDKYGHIDHVFELTATIQQMEAVDLELTIDAMEYTEQTTGSLEANMDGNATFTKLAVIFLRSNKRRKDNRSLTLTGLVESTTESPRHCLDQPSMHGTLELMRSIPKVIYERDGIRVNCIYPGRTESLTNTSNFDTPDLTEYAQTNDDCARFYLGVANNPSMNGKSIYVKGGKGWELEEGLPQSISNKIEKGHRSD